MEGCVGKRKGEGKKSWGRNWPRDKVGKGRDLDDVLFRRLGPKEERKNYKMIRRPYLVLQDRVIDECSGIEIIGYTEMLI